MKLRFTRVGEMQQHLEGQKIEDGTDGVDEEHEIAAKINVPGPGLLLPSTSTKRICSAKGNSPPYRQVALDANTSDR